MASAADDVVVEANEVARVAFSRVFRFPGQQSPAIKCSNANGRLPIFGFDQSPSAAKKRGAKDYVVTSYGRLWPYMEAQPLDRRCFYEILLHQMPTKIYVDIDADLRLNPLMTPDVVKARTTELMAELRFFLAELTRNPELADAPYLVLGSSTPIKLSLHTIVHTFMRNNYDVGAFIRRLRNRLLRKYEKEPGKGDQDNDHPFYLWSEEKDTSQPLGADGVRPLKRVRRFFCDLKVYTKRRNFRLYGSSKAGDYRPLRLQDEDPDSPLDPQVFQLCMLQRRGEGEHFYACREEDGSLPQSIASADIFRYDLGPTVAPRQQQQPSASAAAAAIALPPSLVTEKMLQDHWTTLFPTAALWRFLQVDAEQASGEWQREFIFVDRTDRWNRHRHFRNAAALVQALVREMPIALHIGPLEATGEAGGVRQTSVVFDVDIRDYAKWRSCCGSNGIACATCWPIAQFAQRALTAFIEDEYAMGKVWTFFSGGKGIHVWANPNGTGHEILNKQGREVIVGDFHSVKKTTGLARTYIQTALGTEVERNAYRTFLRETMELGSSYDGRELTLGRDRAIVEYMWPELDANVTKDDKHPLKSPFSLHARTGNVCVWLPDASVNPFDTNRADPMSVVAAFASALAQ